jgi:hypothetical protein
MNHNGGAQRVFAFSMVEEETEMADNDNGASGLGWFLAGLGVGALVGVLYAPKAGK